MAKCQAYQEIDSNKFPCRGGDHGQKIEHHCKVEKLKFFWAPFRNILCGGQAKTEVDGRFVHCVRIKAHQGKCNGVDPTTGKALFWANPANFIGTGTPPSIKVTDRRLSKPPVTIRELVDESAK